MFELLGGTLNGGKREMLMRDSLQRGGFDSILYREMKILSARCQDGIDFQSFRNTHCIRCRYLMMEAAIVAETYEIYFISHWCFSEELRYINVTLQ